MKLASAVTKIPPGIYQNNPLDNLFIRHATPTDWNRIRKDWLMTTRDSDFARMLFHHTSQVYWDWQRAIIDKLLTTSDVHVAAWQDNPDIIAGWSASDQPNILHFVYVLPQYQHAGIAKLLLSHLPEKDVIYTHRPSKINPARLPATWTYDIRPALSP